MPTPPSGGVFVSGTAIPSSPAGGHETLSLSDRAAAMPLPPYRHPLVAALTLALALSACASLTPPTPATTPIGAIQGAGPSSPRLGEEASVEGVLTADFSTGLGIWAMQDVVQIDTFVLRGFGHYHEEYARTPEGWKIKRSTLTRTNVDTEGEVPGR